MHISLQKGFTLAETLVFTFILTLVVALAIPVVSESQYSQYITNTTREAEASLQGAFNDAITGQIYSEQEDGYPAPAYGIHIDFSNEIHSFDLFIKNESEMTDSGDVTEYYYDDTKDIIIESTPLSNNVNIQDIIKNDLSSTHVANCTTGTKDNKFRIESTSDGTDCIGTLDIVFIPPNGEIIFFENQSLLTDTTEIQIILKHGSKEDISSKTITINSIIEKIST